MTFHLLSIHTIILQALKFYLIISDKDGFSNTKESLTFANNDLNFNNHASLEYQVFSRV